QSRRQREGSLLPPPSPLARPASTPGSRPALFRASDPPESEEPDRKRRAPLPERKALRSCAGGPVHSSRREQRTALDGHCEVFGHVSIMSRECDLAWEKEDGSLALRRLRFRPLKEKAGGSRAAPLNRLRNESVDLANERLDVGNFENRPVSGVDSGITCVDGDGARDLQVQLRVAAARVSEELLRFHHARGRQSVVDAGLDLGLRRGGRRELHCRERAWFHLSIDEDDAVDEP